MTFDDFAMIIGAVLFANLLTVSFVYGATLLTKSENANMAGMIATIMPIAVFLLVMLEIVPKPI